MRNIFFITVTCLCIFCCCGHDGTRERLEKLETEIGVNPDSVYSELQGIKKYVPISSVDNKMYYRYLRMKCQNILDLDFDTITALIDVADYFEQYGPNPIRMESRYLLGRAFHILGQDMMAIECFCKCLEISEHSDVDCILLSKVHSQLSAIYQNQHLADNSLEELKMARICALQGNDSILALRYRSLMSTVYEYKGIRDSVIFIGQEVASTFNRWGMKKDAAQALDNIIYAYIDRGQLTEAKECLDAFESESELFYPDGSVIRGWEIHHYLKGRYYLAKNNLDSAEYSFRRLLDSNTNFNNPETAYKGLLNVYTLRHNADSIGKYSNLYCEANDSMLIRQLTDETYKAKAMYDYTRYKENAQRMKEEAEIQRNTVVFAIVSSVFIISVLLIYMSQFRKRKREELEALINKYTETNKLITDLSKDKEELVRKYTQELETIKASIVRKNYTFSNKGIGNFDSTLLFNFNIVACGYDRNVHIGDEDWQYLRTEMGNKEPDFVTFLQSAKLTIPEQRIAMLIRLKFRDDEIKRIIDNGGSYYNNCKTRINKKLFMQEGGKTLRSNIYIWRKNNISKKEPKF